MNATAKLVPGATPRRALLSVVASTLFGIVGIMVFSIQPGYVQGLVNLGGLSGAQAGYVVSAEMAGYAITMIVLGLISHRLRWRSMLIVFVFLQAGGNIACAFHGDVGSLSAARFVAGLGSGGLMSIAFSAIGLSPTPDRHFDFMGMWMLGYGAAGLWVLPSLLKFVGLHGLYIMVAAATLVTLGLVKYMPRAVGEPGTVQVGTATVSVMSRGFAVVSIFGFYQGCGMLWAYISLIGTKAGLDVRAVAFSLVLAQCAGIAGASTAGFLGARFGRLKPLGVIILLAAVASAALNYMGNGNIPMFAAMVCLFNFAWSFAQPVYLSAATGFDQRGRLVPLMTAASACGLAAGPFTGATIGGEANSRMLVWAVTLILLGAFCLILLPFIESIRTKLTP